MRLYARNNWHAACALVLTCSTQHSQHMDRPLRDSKYAGSAALTRLTAYNCTFNLHIANVLWYVLAPTAFYCSPRTQLILVYLSSAG